MPVRWILASILLAGLASCSSAYTAEVEIVHAGLWQEEIPTEAYRDGTADETPKCNVNLSGEITTGDLGKLEDAYTTATRPRKHMPSFLCLDSAGGSYADAISIVRWLLKGKGQGIGTIVPAGASCLSACALIFMAGSEIQHPWGHAPNRHLHVKGRLGFHAPYIDPATLGERSFDTRDALTFFRAAQKGISELLGEFKQAAVVDRVTPFPQVWAKASLFYELLLKEPNELLMIDSVDRAGRWEINLLGIEPMKGWQLSEDMGRTACRNALAWSSDSYAEGDQRIFDGTSLGTKDRSHETDRSVNGRRFEMSFRIQHRHTDAICVIHVWERHGAIQTISAHFKEVLDDGSSGEIYMGATLPYDPRTKLENLPIETVGSSDRGPTTTSSNNSRPNITAWNNHDLEGGDLRHRKGVSQADCSSQCDADPACIGFSYDKWNRWCFLKSSLGTLRFDPKYAAAAKSGEPARSPEPIVVQVYRGKTFARMVGEGSPAGTFEACQQHCDMLDRDCTAFTFLKSSRRCVTLSEPGEYVSDVQADSGVKRQPPSR